MAEHAGALTSRNSPALTTTGHGMDAPGLSHREKSEQSGDGGQTPVDGRGGVAGVAAVTDRIDVVATTPGHGDFPAGGKQAQQDVGRDTVESECFTLRPTAERQLRHSFGTSLVNAGIGLPALMALMGHVTPEMTLRYAKLSSPTVRFAYETAMTKVRGRGPLFVLPPGGTSVPSRVDWLRSELLKTRVAHGYCSREPVAGPCPYANICEQCDNFTTAPEFAPALADQLADLNALRDDAEARGWGAEAARHSRVAEHLEAHLRNAVARAGKTSR